MKTDIGNKTNQQINTLQRMRVDKIQVYKLIIFWIDFFYCSLNFNSYKIEAVIIKSKSNPTTNCLHVYFLSNNLTGHSFWWKLRIYYQQWDIDIKQIFMLIEKVHI